jgi:hypothetical protein
LNLLKASRNKDLNQPKQGQQKRDHKCLTPLGMTFSFQSNQSHKSKKSQFRQRNASTPLSMTKLVVI